LESKVATCRISAATNCNPRWQLARPRRWWASRLQLGAGVASIEVEGGVASIAIERSWSGVGFDSDVGGEHGQINPGQ
jgi:hypothetical protein